MAKSELAAIENLTDDAYTEMLEYANLSLQGGLPAGEFVQKHAHVVTEVIPIRPDCQEDGVTSVTIHTLKTTLPLNGMNIGINEDFFGKEGSRQVLVDLINSTYTLVTSRE